jgi:hypothetical protein
MPGESCTCWLLGLADRLAQNKMTSPFENSRNQGKSGILPDVWGARICLCKCSNLPLFHTVKAIGVKVLRLRVELLHLQSCCCRACKVN